MREHLRRRVTQYRPATPMRPDHRGNAAMVTRYGGVGASAAWFACGSMSRALALDETLLPDAHGIAFVALPSIRPGGHPRQRVGARNAAAQGSSETC